MRRGEKRAAQKGGSGRIGDRTGPLEEGEFKARPAAPSVDDEPAQKRRRGTAPTVTDILNDPLTPIANAFWAGGSGPDGTQGLQPYNAQVIEDIYFNELQDTDINSQRIVLLELSAYLEKYRTQCIAASRSVRLPCRALTNHANECVTVTVCVQLFAAQFRWRAFVVCARHVNGLYAQ
jgi:hypothetical protein